MSQFESIDLITDSDTLRVSGRDPYAFISLTGRGNPPTRRLKERGAQQLGSTDIGFTLDERILNLALKIIATSHELADQYRDELAEKLMPTESTPVKLRVTRTNETVRQIDTFTVGIVDFPNTVGDRMGTTQLVVIQLEAADPIPYDPTLRNIIFNTSGGGYQVPMEVPFLYTSGSTINKLAAIPYEGKWQTFPKIYATGPAEDLVITNVTTGKVLDFTGHTIAGGDTYEIDLAWGQKLITDQNGVNKNLALLESSNLVDWSIVPSNDSINDILVEVADDATLATRIRFEFYDRYPSLG